MHKKLLDILVNFVIGLKDGVTEPVRNLVFDIKYELLAKEETYNFEDEVVEEKPKKKKGKKKKSK